MNVYSATLLLRFAGEQSVRMQRYAGLVAETHAAAFSAALRAASEEYERSIDRILLWNCDVARGADD